MFSDGKFKIFRCLIEAKYVPACGWPYLACGKLQVRVVAE